MARASAQIPGPERICKNQRSLQSASARNRSRRIRSVRRRRSPARTDDGGGRNRARNQIRGIYAEKRRDFPCRGKKKYRVARRREKIRTRFGFCPTRKTRRANSRRATDDL